MPRTVLDRRLLPLAASAAKRLVVFGAVLVALMAGVPGRAEAQQQVVVVAGQVVDSVTRRPLGEVQVFVAATNTGARTTADGRYTLRLAPGAHEVRFILLGYRPRTRAVTVVAGTPVTLNVAMEVTALGLDAVVVTGTAGEARKREVGNSMASMDITAQNTTPPGIDQLLQGKTAGVMIMPSSGLSGSGAQIRLRGNVSVAMSNQPLIYVDGVRLRSEMYPKNAATLIERDIRSSNDAIGPLGDINPADIDRIEIIKGAAATTLYGTEAAAGVIQIFTKKGSTGGNSMSMLLDQGMDWMQKFGTDANPYLGTKPFLRNGRTQSYGVSLSGGVQNSRYFVSANLDRSLGVLPNDNLDRKTLRANLDLMPMPTLLVGWNSAFTASDIQNTPSGNNSMGITYNTFTAPAGFVVPKDIPRLLEYEITSAIRRFNTGVTLTYTPIAALTNRLTVGYDLSNLEQRNLRPFGFILTPAGTIEVNRWSGEIQTLDYVSTFKARLPFEVGGSFSVGAQAVSSEETAIDAASRNFPGPGLATVSSGSEKLSSETRQRVINGGFFGQALFDFKNRYFLTLGMRVDGNSAFGESFGLQNYPKASFAWVLSDEPFWNKSVGEVKIRAAFGEAGRAPGAFDAVRTWNPVGWGGQPAFETRTLGNPDLGPERTREAEVGFEGAFMNSRLNVDFTYYNQHTVDALMPVSLSASAGFTGSQLMNIGELSNQGMELAVNTVAIDRESFGLNVGLRLSTNKNEVVDMGGTASFSLGAEGWVVVGQPAPVLIAPHVTNPDAFADPVIDANHMFGANMPTKTYGVTTDVRLPMGIKLNLLGEYMGGHYIKNRAARTMAQRGVMPQCSEMGIYDKIKNKTVDDVTAFWRYICTPAKVDLRTFIEKADFFKLRNISLSLPITRWVPKANTAMLSLSVRNVLQWRNKDVLLLDPEMAGQEGASGKVREMVETLPPASSFVTSVKITF